MQLLRPLMGGRRMCAQRTGCCCVLLPRTLQANSKHCAPAHRSAGPKHDPCHTHSFGLIPFSSSRSALDPHNTRTLFRPFRALMDSDKENIPIGNAKLHRNVAGAAPGGGNGSKGPAQQLYRASSCRAPLSDITHLFNQKQVCVQRAISPPIANSSSNNMQHDSNAPFCGFAGRLWLA
jgi:hypothetical protein